MKHNYYKRILLTLAAFILSTLPLFYNEQNIFAQKNSPSSIKQYKKIRNAFKKIPETLTIYSGYKKKIKIQLPYKIRWSSANRNIFTVNKKGQIKAKKVGQTQLTISVKKARKTVTVNVLPGTISLNQDSKKLYINRTFTPKIIFKHVKDKKLKMVSSNPEVASVNKSGMITAVTPGSATITYKTQDGAIASCLIAVNRGYRLGFENEITTMEVGSTTMNPVKKSSQFNDIISYKSSNENVAVVTSSGKIIALSPGVTTITACGSQDSCVSKVTVTKKILATSASANTIIKQTILPSTAAHFIAHRGYVNGGVENTITAFKNAIIAGFWGVETDIYSTKDGVFVLNHDGKVWTNGRKAPSNLTDKDEIEGIINKLTYEQVENLSHGEIPTLESLLKLVEPWDITPLLEIKNLVRGNQKTLDRNNEQEIASQVHRLLNLIDKYSMTKRCYITSFSSTYLEHVRAQNKDIKIQFITNKKEVDLDYLESNNFGLDWAIASSNKETINEIKKRKINLCLYIADTPEEAKKAIELGADAITSNVKVFEKTN
ncbi:glycerophosphodiester phosphodiesterase family protein [Eubacterium xylanophilum]|uniref:glycerophosphodiester phosphodiesterase family protein n=1 Tax=Eubacterium xylanophilum TaxID=39497 RepID=UPI00047DA1AA|nr:glycerophosphodiester phosphodiesterase family protein [Eubacterium xylanophilum]